MKTTSLRMGDKEREALAYVKDALRERSDSEAIRKMLVGSAALPPSQIREIFLADRESEQEKTHFANVEGTINAGQGMPVIPYAEPCPVVIPQEIPAHWYGLDVSGDSMDGGNLPIRNGDILIFEKSNDAPNGAIVHAEWLELGTNQPYCTVKKFQRDDKNRVTLLPANEDGYGPMIFDPQERKVEEFQIKGIMRRHFKP